MDPFAPEGELVHIHTAFVQAQYAAVLADYTPASFSDPNRLPARILQHRAQCALSQHAEVLSAISPGEARSVPALAALRAFATALQSPPNPDTTSAAEALAATHPTDPTAILLAATLLARAGALPAALALLSTAPTPTLDARALQVQIHLQQHRTDLAASCAAAARAVAQDVPLVNLAESWVGLRRGGAEYQRAFYVYEELAQGPASSSAASLVGQAVCEMHLGRLEEAEVGLQAALGLEGGNWAARANLAVVRVMRGQGMGEDEGGLGKDFGEKRDAFRVAAGKFQPKFEA